MASFSIARGLSRVIHSKYPLLYLGSGLLLGVLSNSVHGALAAFLSPAVLLAVTAAALVLLVVALSCDFARNRTAFVVEGAEPPPLKRGLICLVSGGSEATVEAAVSYHRPALERLWLVTTDSFLGLAQELVTAYAKLAPQVVHIPDAARFDHRAVEQKVDDLYFDLPEDLTPTDVISDITGGTKPMSLGMMLACLDAQRDLQYIPQRTEPGRDGRPVVVSAEAPILIHVVRR